jgi:hypothetical protein
MKASRNLMTNDAEGGNMVEPIYFSIRDIRARYPQASERTLANWSARGILPPHAFRVGRARFWLKSDIEALAPQPNPEVETHLLTRAA